MESYELVALKVAAGSATATFSVTTNIVNRRRQPFQPALCPHHSASTRGNALGPEACFHHSFERYFIAVTKGIHQSRVTVQAPRQSVLVLLFQFLQLVGVVARGIGRHFLDELILD